MIICKKCRTKLKIESFQLFKSRFKNWTDVLKVDYSKTPSTVDGPQVKKDASETKIDLSAIFLPRQPPMADNEVLYFLIEII